MAETILVVEDEKRLNVLIADYLSALGYRVLSAFDGPGALSQLSSVPPDMVILDIGLPGLDGYDVLKKIRREGNTPVIMLTARSEETDKLMGLEMGADDYMTKPFSMKELEARIRAVLRRSAGGIGAHSEGPVLRVRDLVMDTEKRLVTRSGKETVLTSVQFDLLQTMMKRPGRVYTRMELLETFQDMGFEGYERTIDVHIKNIRRAVEPDPGNPEYVLTVWGVGYKMAEHE